MQVGGGGLKLYCTTVQFITMQVGGGGITVVPYNSSKFIYYCSLVEWGGRAIVIIPGIVYHTEVWSRVHFTPLYSL